MPAVNYDAGFIGLGQMGLPMVENLSKRGFRVIAFARKESVAEQAKSFSGVDIVRSCRTVAEQAPLVFTCLSSVEAMEEVYFGSDGIAGAARRGLITCDCSTIPPEAAKSIGARLEAAGIVHFDAPIFGTPDQARDVDTFFAVSGKAEKYPLLVPFLDAMARSHRYVGEAGVACSIKLLQNGLGNTYAVLTGEVLALCRRLDIDVDAFIDVVREANALGWSNYLMRYAQAAAHGLDTDGGRLFICAKDAASIHALARENGLGTPILAAAAEAYARAMAAGAMNEQFTAVTRFAAERSPSAQDTKSPAPKAR